MQRPRTYVPFSAYSYVYTQVLLTPYYCVVIDLILQIVRGCMNASEYVAHIFATWMVMSVITRAQIQK